MVEVTAAINDAPMGTLTFEDEVFDLRAAAGHRDGPGAEGPPELPGDRPAPGDAARSAATPRWWSARTGREVGLQADTAVSRAHRGHRLGLLLKIDMMRWLAEAEPQLEVMETWNNADNGFMVRVNELLGYRLSQVYATYELTLSP